MQSKFVIRIVWVVLCAALLVSPLAIAQVDSSSNPKGITQKSLDYHEYRLSDTEPRFHLARVKRLIEKIKPKQVGDTDDMIGAISNRTFRQLSVPARFTYCMLQPEEYGQNCDGMPAFLNEENLIFAQPSQAFWGQQEWSDRQRHFLHNHRHMVVQLLRQSIRNHVHVGVNFKKAILEIDAYELIPDLIRNYKKAYKDRDILSTLSLLMKHAQFQPYCKSAAYRQFYGDDESYQTHVPYTKDLEQFIIASALGSC